MSNKVSFVDGKLVVPNDPTVYFIEGDGIGVDVWESAVKVFNTAVEVAYDGKRSIDWVELLAGEKAFDLTGEWLPRETVDAVRDGLVAIKGPLGTPTGGGIRSLNVTLRQELDLFACVRPIRYFEGVPAPVKKPENVDLVIFRENTEDIYSGIEWEAGSDDVKKLVDFLVQEMGTTKIRFPETSSIGVKPISVDGSKRLVRSAIQYAIDNNINIVTIVHKGNIQKFTEGGFRKWGYEVAYEEFNDLITDGELVVNDLIADNFFQQVLLYPERFGVVALTNLNGDYVSDAVAAQVGGIGISPGANINYNTGHAIFEATHGTAPDIAGKGVANPCSLILSGVMLFNYLGFNEVAELIVSAVEDVLSSKHVTGDFASQMDDAVLVNTEEFTGLLIDSIKA